MRLDEIATPALVLDLDRIERNVAAMARRASDLGVALRPHFKTHKCLEIAQLQAAHGARGFTVSTLAEARALASAGFSDLTWAVPVSPSRLSEVETIAASARIGVLVDSEEAVEWLARRRGDFEVWIEVDCGDHRTGVAPEGSAALGIARRIEGQAGLRLRGLLTHSGQAYACRGREALARVAEHERRVMVDLAQRLAGAGIAVEEISVGSTPAMCAAESLAGVSEARPGNYALFDLTQVALGACQAADCAVSVLATVISARRDEGRCVVDAGALALSKDAGADGGDQGRLWEDYAAGVLAKAGRVVEVSQEHGALDVALPVGSRVRIAVQHACLAVACWDEAWIVRGDETVGRWRIHRER